MVMVRLLLIHHLYFTFCIVVLVTFARHAVKNYRQQQQKQTLQQRKRCYTGWFYRGNIPIDEAQWCVLCLLEVSSDRFRRKKINQNNSFQIHLFTTPYFKFTSIEN